MNSNNNSNKDYQKLLIAHGGGVYNGLIYTNSLEAFHENYRNGYRRFELDILLTKENELISCHNELGYNFIPKDQLGKLTPKYLLTSVSGYPHIVNSPIFIPKKEKIIKQYNKQNLTPITADDLASLCKSLPDLEIILDTKYTKHDLYMKQFNIIRKAFEAQEVELNQLTPQFYNTAMAKDITNEFDFQNNIYTLYMQQFKVEKILRQLDEIKKIKGITVSKNRLLKCRSFIERLHDIGRTCNVHTITKEEELEEYAQMQVDGIYTTCKGSKIYK